MGFIDAHVHVWTDDLERYSPAPGFTRADMAPPTFPPEELLAHCRPSGVDRVVLVQMSYYGTDNSYLLDTIARRPGVFRGVAVVDHQAPGPAEELSRLWEGGVRGLRLQPGGAGPAAWLSGEAEQRLLRLAGELGLVVCPLMGPEYLPAIGRAAEAFPGTTFAIDHLARIGAGEPVRGEQVEALCALARRPNVLVKVSAFYALGEKRPPHDDLRPLIRRVTEAFGAERLMWGSDCPFQVLEETYEDSIALIRDRLGFVSSGEVGAILGGTADRVFFA